ncbi:MAG TPA: Maf family protein [Casimicrobiaceae bacterium]|nr:Maf family protein [Casimicrobiaceae bacterium]
MSIYLASKSPRRRELLQQLGIGFKELHLREAAGRSRDIVEEALDDEPAAHYVERIARTKANVGWKRIGQRGAPSGPVLGADTEVVLDGDIFGKPRDAAHAVEMLKRLSGRSHDVLTGVAVKTGEDIEFAMSTSKVVFRPLSDQEIARYVASGEAADKAGAYAIQGRAAAFVERLEGSYSGVMGLPLFETAALLKKAGIPVL